MSSTKDQMQDVFPVNFEYVSGEQPDSIKLTGTVKQTDTAFSRVTRAIGDPWEYNTHSNGTSTYLLSPARLAQSSLARIIGPTDWIGPEGSSWSESTISDVNIVLDANRNSWRLGFPLVTKSTDIHPSSADLYSTVFTALSIGSGITIITDDDNIFTTVKSSEELLQVDGDYYIDAYKGIIKTFTVPSSNVTLSVSNINMLGPGVPWGTANIIPTWKQTSNLCTATVDPLDNTKYILSLPNIEASTRSNCTGIYSPDTTWAVAAPGESAKYRLPYSLVENLSSALEIPDGFMYLWDETTQRIVPLIEFIYDTEYTVILSVPSAGWITEGSNYRLILTGTSLAESVNYLSSIVRDNIHRGLSNGQDRKTLSYSIPLSHDDLTDLSSGILSSSQANIEKYKYVTSIYPINAHPQYLHRAGYMEADEANTNNMMRGLLALSGEYDSTAEEFPINTNGCNTNTYAISFGGSLNNVANQNPRIYFGNGKDISTWTSGVSHRLGFGLIGTDFNLNTDASTYFGALCVTQHYGLPLYLKGRKSSASPQHSGGSIGFDYYGLNELNFLKIRDVNAAYSTEHASYTPFKSLSASSRLAIMPSIDGSAGIVIGQTREYRFSVNSYNAASDNKTNSIGGQSSISEFNNYLHSPAIVGADWFNVYGNAIFFSEEGDGKGTSLHKRYSNWLNYSVSNDYPVGLYYKPQTHEGSFNFAVPYSSTKVTSSFTTSYKYTKLSAVNTSGSQISEIVIRSDTNPIGINLETTGSNKAIALTTDSSNINLTTTSGNIILKTTDTYLGKIDLQTENTNISLISTTGSLNLITGGIIQITGRRTIIESEGIPTNPYDAGVHLVSENGYIFIDNVTDIKEVAIAGLVGCEMHPLYIIVDSTNSNYPIGTIVKDQTAKKP